MYNEASYWENRYARGNTSGSGSRGAEAAWKVQQVVTVLPGVRSVLDLGSGDGHLAAAILAERPDLRYTGYDISPTIVSQTNEDLASEHVSFIQGDLSAPLNEQADMVLCLDVLFHQATQEAHDQLVTNICNCFKKVAVVSAWTSEILAQCPKGMAVHNMYRPTNFPDHIKVQEVPIPSCPGKVLYTLTK